MPLTKLPFSNSRPEEQRQALSKAELMGKSDIAISKHRQLLRWYGVETDEQTSEYVGDCPFCGHTGKFSMNKQTAQWQCFAMNTCGKKGNAYDFIRSIHAKYLEETTESMLLDLKALRKDAIDLEELKDFQLAFNTMTEEWMLPAWSSEGTIVNLYVWRAQQDQDTGKFFRQIMASPGLNQIPYGLQRLTFSTDKPLWIVEGHWDYLAFYGLLRRTKQLGNHDVIGTPGATTIPRKYLSLLSGRNLFVIMDNDKAGEDHANKLFDSMSRDMITPKSVYKMKWPEGFKTGFDVSDVITSLPVTFWNKK